MKSFAYARPGHAEEAVRLATVPGTCYLAGGTNLVDLMKLRIEVPDRLVDIARLPYDFVTAEPDGSVRIGATVRNSDLAVHPEIRRRFPVLSQALLDGASGQLRNAATVAGNLLQRTRCTYFQDVSKPCNKRSRGSGCPARDGEHRNLAILGASEHCVATHSSDMAVALTALDAVVRVQTESGPQEIALADFYVGPGADPSRETTLRPGALITAVDVPPLPFAANSQYRKARDRASFAFAIGSVAAALDVADGRVRDVRLAFGAVAPMPWRARVAEDALRGRSLDVATIREALVLEFANARPLRDNGYKIDLVTAMAERVLVELGAQQ